MIGWKMLKENNQIKNIKAKASIPEQIKQWIAKRQNWERLIFM